MIVLIRAAIDRVPNTFFKLNHNRNDGFEISQMRFTYFSHLNRAPLNILTLPKQKSHYPNVKIVRDVIANRNQIIVARP